jgi:hypothetical protein
MLNIDPPSIRERRPDLLPGPPFPRPGGPDVPKSTGLRARMGA